MASADTLRTVRSFCRICAGTCGVVLDVAADRIVGIRGDKDNPLTRGYSCIKGLQAGELLHGPGRLTKPLRRRADGTHEEIPLEQALEEISARLGTILDRHGSRAVGAWRGTNPWYQTLSYFAVPDFVRSLGSDQFYTSMTIDQSAKWVVMERMGVWSAGRHIVDEADVAMFVGNNPLVSVSGISLSFNPQKKLRALKARGLKLIVIDPRRTEMAEQADLFLQLRPGEDVAMAAGLLHVILAEGLEDAGFCASFVNGLADLRAAVAPFTPAQAAARTGVPADQIRAAARLFAQGGRGSVQTGTGPDMGPRSNLAEHLYECINVVCGRFMRAGDRVSNPGVMNPARPWRALVVPPRRRYEQGTPSRVRGLGPLLGEMMAGVLPEEITAPGEDRLRAFFVVGGNPAAAIPDQRGVVAALRQLELLVSIDPVYNETARLADYVLPPRVLYEVPGLPLFNVEPYFLPVPFAQYAPAAIPAPPDTLDDWRYLWEICRRLGKQFVFDRVPLDMAQAPTSEDLIRLVLRRSQVPFEEISRHPSGKVFAMPEQFVEASGSDGRFEVMPADVAGELAEVAAEHHAGGEHEAYPLRLIIRRMRETLNGQFRQLPRIRARVRHNPAWCHPDDIAALGLASGALVEIVSDFGRIPAVLEADPTLRPGALAMTHGFGGLPDDPLDPREYGANVSLLINARRDCEPINAMPRMSAIPVRIEAATPA